MSRSMLYSTRHYYKLTAVRNYNYPEWERTDMNANQLNTNEKSNKGRRQFLQVAGGALLAGAAIPQAAQASHISDGTSIIYTGGVITSPDAPGLILNVYLAGD